jgi:hypothetical protein
MIADGLTAMWPQKKLLWVVPCSSTMQRLSGQFVGAHGGPVTGRCPASQRCPGVAQAGGAWGGDVLPYLATIRVCHG